MGWKPKKPDKKITAPIKELDRVLSDPKKTKADTKALGAAHKELKAADKQLGSAMAEAFRVFDEAHQKTCPLLEKPGPAGPVPIPYPVIAKAEKSSKAALGKLEKAQKKHEKVSVKLMKVLDKEIKTLKSSGDEAGTLKGLMASHDMAKAKYQMYSMDVKVEGKNVLRHFDLVNKAAKK